MSAGSTRERLIPRWFAPVTVTALAVFTLAFGVAALATDDGVMTLSIGVLALACGLMLVATCSALLRPRRRSEPRVAADGTRTFLAPAATVWPLVGAMVGVLGVAGLWAYLAVTDFDQLESPGYSLVTIAAALALIPDLVRLLTGRLHRWRLELGPEALVYRGYRTDLTIPWSKVGRATLQAKPPAGVRINVRGIAEAKDPVVPYLAFAVPAEQLVEEIERAKAAARR